MATLSSFSVELGDNGLLYWGWEQDPHLVSFVLVTPVGGYSTIAFSTTPFMVGARGVVVLKEDEHPSLQEVELTGQDEEVDTYTDIQHTHTYTRTHTHTHTKTQRHKNTNIRMHTQAH
jgi:ABC-type nickel/cobalt efflux system permease component RcnA